MSDNSLLNKPIASKISLAIEMAQKGDRQRAIEILDLVERDLFHKRTNNSSQNLNLIQLIREKYKLLQILSSENIETLFNNGKVGAGFEKRLPGISLVNCARNRTDNLLKALPTWLYHKEIKEIIIVDWTSDIPVRDVLNKEGFIDKRIKVVQVKDEPKWILSYAYNLGFRVAQHEYILKVDADITLKENFFDKNVLQPGTYIAGDWQKAEKGQEHINGFFFVRANELLRIKGFNEYITTYGWDDDDIYARLITSGLKRICVDTASIYHIPHDDASRLDGVEKEDTSAWRQLQGDPLFKIRANRYLTLVMPYWSADRNFAPFKILENKSGLLIVKRIADEMPHYVSSTMRRDAEVYSATEILSWRLGPTIFHVERVDFEQLLSKKKISEISQFDIDILTNGLHEIKKISRRSIYLEFQLCSYQHNLNPLIKMIEKYFGRDDLAIFVSSYGEGADFFSKKLSNQVLRLHSWVRTDGLKTIDKDNIDQLENFLDEGSGCHIRVTNELMDSLAIKSYDIKISRERIYIDVQHGLGNRLRAFGSAAAIARSTNRELVVVWIPDFHCECKFSDLFNYDGAVIESYADLPKNIRNYNYMEIEEDAKKNEEIILKNGSDVLVRSAFVLNHCASDWNSENAEIQKLKPVKEVLDLVDKVKLPSNAISIHVRMEAGKGRDNNVYDAKENWSKESHEQIHYWREKSHYSFFMKRIDSILECDPTRSIFLATDLPENYNAFIETYGQKLFYLPRDVFDRSKQQIQYALADAILLSKGTHLLGSNWSSFSEIAMRLSTSINKIEMSGIDF